MVVHSAVFIPHSSSSCWRSARSTLCSLYLPALLCTYVVCSAQGTACTPFSSEQLLLSLQRCVQQTSLLSCGQPAQCIHPFEGVKSLLNAIIDPSSFHLQWDLFAVSHLFVNLISFLFPSDYRLFFFNL